MIKSKSKGNTINVAQMVGCVGQQNVEGRRIPYGFDDRTLPHFAKYDDGPESRGFVESSFINGLSPSEFYMHAQGGREGLIDTAVNTSETGYIQRKLVKAMEDCKVNYDMTVRNAAGVIVQYVYGEDGMDCCKIDSQSIPHIDMDMDKIASIYDLVHGADDFKAFLSAENFAELKKKETELKERMALHHKQVLEDRESVIIKIHGGKMETSVMYPVSLARILTNVQNMYARYDANIAYDLDPLYILDTIESLIKELIVTKVNPANRLFAILLRAYLSPKRVIIQHRLTRTAFDAVVEQIKFRFFESLVNPSEMVGVVAAQSLGEPATQLTLNSFHSAGISSASKAIRGVPRLNELLAVSKNIKTPYMQIYLKEEFRHDRRTVIDIANNIRTVRFRDIIKSSTIYFDPDEFNTNIPDDRGFVQSYKDFMGETACQKNSPWVLRMEFDRDKMKELNLDMLTLHYVLDSFYDDNISCVFADDNSQQLVMRIRLTTQDGDNDKNEKKSSDDVLTDLKALEHNIIENVTIKGVKGIERVAIDEKSGRRYNPVTKTFDSFKEFMIFTDGSNLRDVLALPYVDAARVTTNDVNEIYEVLGIEAARQALHNEFVEVLEGIQVNYRHIALLVDVMCNRGGITSVNRHGIGRGDIGPLAKCSFEETTDKLIKAGLFAEYDKMNGVSSNLMCGQIAPCGTGDVTVVMDEFLVSQMQAPQAEHHTFEMDDEDINAECAADVLKMEMPTATATDAIERKTDNEIVFI